MKIIQTFALFVFSISLFGQTLAPTVIKNNPHINYTHLNHIETMVKPYLEQKKLVGSVVLVVKDNQVVHYKGYGQADAEHQKPMEANTIFRIMSQTKAITSLAIMQLFEQGKLDLDQKVSDFLPEYKNQTVVNEFNEKDSTFTTIKANREITIRDLLTHTSGIDYSDIGSNKMKAIYAKAMIPSGLGEFKVSLLDRMKALGKLPLAHQPGEKFTYGLNSDLLGCLVEVISGETLEQYFQKHIFDPMGMKDTYFNLPAEKANRLAGVYTENEQKQVIPWGPTFRNINPNYPLAKKSYFSGGAGLSSTAYDYAIFLQMLLNKGAYNGQQIIGRRTAELMVSPQLNPGLLGNDNFGLGFQIQSAKSANLKMRSEGSFSWGGYYGTTYWADPKENLIVLIMTQHTPNSNGFVAGRIENIIYGSLK